MKLLHLVVGILWLLALAAAHEMWDDTTSISQPARPAPESHSFSAPRRDLYGNQVHDAVGDYRIDPRGHLYERHAPDTAVLRLGPPGA